MLFSMARSWYSLGIADLEIPKSGDQEQEYRDHEVLEKGDFLRRELAVVAQKVPVGIWIVFAVVAQFHKLSPRFSGYLQFIQKTKQRQSHGRV